MSGMNLDNFETHMGGGVLERGLSYYVQGNVVSLVNNGTEWKAAVRGSRNYTVTVGFSGDNNISRTGCSCPYDGGRYCKHQAAVFYALRDMLMRDRGPGKAAKGKEESLEEVLGRLDRDTLLSILTEFAGRDWNMAEEIVLRYSGKADVLRSARNIIQNAVRSAEHSGFGGYDGSPSVAEGLETVFRIAEEKMRSGDIQTAVSLCMEVLEEMIGLIERYDDYYGDVEGAIDRALEIVGDAVSEPAALENSEKIFDIVFEEASDPAYDDWGDWQTDLMSALVPLCGNPRNRSKMEEFLSGLCFENEDGNMIYDGESEMLQYEIIRRFDGGPAAESYIEEHLDNRDLRLIAIRNAMEKGAYKDVLDLCSDGEAADFGYARLMEEYKELRYEAYERMGDVQAQRDLGSELLKKGDLGYFPKVKALYGDGEWPAALQGILVALKARGSKDAYVRVLIQEGLKAKLLEYCTEDVSAIVPYHSYLLPKYKKEVCAIFLRCIEEQAANAGGRDSYRSVCWTLELYREACGDNAYAVRDELRKKYSRRPAFVDELSRL